MHAPPGPAGDLYRNLCEVVPLDECDVYSWFPSPEYDPHVDPEEGEMSDDGYDYSFDEDDEEVLERLESGTSASASGMRRGIGSGSGTANDVIEIDMDGEDDVDIDIDNGPDPSWGQAGMEIEVEDLTGGGVQVVHRDSRGKRKSVDMLPPMLPKRSSDEYDLGVRRRGGGGLLWSANYFFYSK